ncbi:phosphotriesterase family protein [Actinocorallia populi]|uniref:phosphotriesterase family protein n=1 Tax=Actinocorallia populi TaxID=2079200 RepID=UPI000D0915F8|nr:aryldialkylphosphatase [Actinocorallia populi]
MTDPATDAPIRTVTGPLPISAVQGGVLAHEHLRMDLRWPVGAESEPRRWLDEEIHVCDELTGLRERGDLGLVVELTCLGMGRDAPALARISAASGVAVVAGTGFFTEPFHPAGARGLDAGRMAERLVAEIGFGMDGTSVLPGVIGEIGCWGEQPTPAEETALKAAAQASLASGLPVATYGRSGPAQLELLMAASLDPARVAVGQQSLSADPGAHRKLAELGAYVCFGRLAATGEQAVRPVLELIEAGYADRLLLGGGICRMEQIAHYGGPGYGTVFDAFVPALRAHGVDEATLDAITRKNALRWLAG